MTNFTGDPEGEEVVFGGKEYRGWRVTFVGCGQMTFAKGWRKFSVCEPTQGQADWVAYCWRAAKALIDAMEEPCTVKRS